LLTALKYLDEWGLPTPSAAFRLTANTGQDMFYGNKYLLDIVGHFFLFYCIVFSGAHGAWMLHFQLASQPFQDDGKLASGATTIVHDAERKRLFMLGTSILPALK
jgi:arylesterase / paraoxonase